MSYEVSYEELAEAVESLSAEEIVLLPNNKNAISTCELFQKRSKRKIHTLPTESEMEGVVALGHYDPELPLEDNLAAMQEALTSTDFFAVQQAVKNYSNGSLSVVTGDYLLLKDGVLLAASKSPEGLLPNLFALLDDKNEFTVYSGVAVSDEEAVFLADAIRKRISATGDVTLIRGDQKIARYLISGEKA